MNKLYLTIIVGIILATGLLIAQATGLTISLSKDTTDILKATNNIQSIDLKATTITCDKSICKSWISQEGLINQEWTTPKQYCSKNKTTENIITFVESNFDTNTQTYINKTITKNTGVFETTCTEYTDKTTLMLESERASWVQEKIGTYAGIQAKRVEYKK